ncbi:MAG: isocitrate/isopropylmalate family dehydrogenase, partial [Candidatus Brocadiales bacterium]
QVPHLDLPLRVGLAFVPTTVGATPGLSEATKSADLGAMIQGGMGIAAGGNINPEGISMFEPIGGSAPKYAGKNVANPLAAICACAMMLDHLGETESARDVEEAVKRVIPARLKGLGAGNMGATTREVGDMVATEIIKKV